ncbi:hypothetical protein L21SP3_00511 [Sedimentisphaera cyanobacteriorum]|uniref:Glycosyl transferase family 8 n=1 Tax=Sedimentisphaera cyanobacteriorum TaxID=1940790 RepID=A0A1Q2HN49_9BACT|nr:hypothetical protein [Sedimentisphaera cyanobacteriorum]AQQ08721.1 hypothetical protein L21SP3_00511 [Sedimentisphaera cyanobacteriorum]
MAGSENLKKRTVVTACDDGYLWGAFLLTASLRRFNVDCDINVRGFGLSSLSASLLEQFGRVNLIQDGKDMAFNGKIAALKTANEGSVTWMDSDCMVNGDVTDYLNVPEDGIRIRFRSKEENVHRFKEDYQPGEAPGSLPSLYTDNWQEDIGELREPRTESAASNCAFTIDASRMDFVEKWNSFMQEIRDSGKQSPAYSLGLSGKRMSDELALNALLAFAEDAPEIHPHLLSNDPKALVVHFYERKKPWVIWTDSQIRHYPLVIDTLEWVKQQGFELPPKLPWTFCKSLKPAAYGSSQLFKAYSEFKKAVKKIIGK